MLAWRAVRGRDREKALYMAALLAGFVAFCAYLKWQPFMARLLVPLLVAAAPAASLIGEIRPAMMALAVEIPLCLLLLANAAFLLQNWTRPLQGPASILHVPRDERYFTDLHQWNTRDSYLQSADLIARTRCNTVGIDASAISADCAGVPLREAGSPRSMHMARW